MAATWKIARVFISSTFRDMQAERDHLVRFVFPRLREELLERRIHPVDVDLRWGITAEQDALEACREIIDECRPRFVCILGGRYGWTPPGREDSITAQEIHHAIFNHAADKAHHFFYFRDVSVTESIPEPEPGVYRELPGSPNQRKLKVLKQGIIDAGYHPRIYSCRWDDNQEVLFGLESFGEQVYADLLTSVEAEFGPYSSETPSEFEEEAAAIETYIEERVSHYVVGNRQPIFDLLQDHASDTEGNAILCLVGESGSGKSALLGRFYRDYVQAISTSRDHHDALIIPHFVGASPASTDLRQMLRRLCHELVVAADLNEVIPDTYEELCDAFPVFLQQVATNRHAVILIDAINLLTPTDDVQAMRWLPEYPPNNTRIILTSPPGPVLNALRARRQPPREITLEPLNKCAASAIVDMFLARYNKQLDATQRSALLAKRDAGLPLYLLTALEELRMLGTYKEITNRIQGLPGETHSLVLWILQRLEGDPGFQDAEGNLVGKTLVQHYFTYLAAGRFGIEERELTDLIAPGDLQGNVAALQRLVRRYLMTQGTLLNFFHSQFRDAVEGIYLNTPEKQLTAHRTLANYFRHQADPSGDSTWHNGSSRGLSELAYHILQSHNIQELENLHSDSAFLEAMCARVNARKMPDGETEYEGILELLSNLRDTIHLLETSQETVSLQLELQLRTLFNLLVERSRLFRSFPKTITQEICNYIDIFPEAPFSQSLLQKAKESVTKGLLLINKPKVTSTIPGHSSTVTTLAVSPSGAHFLLSGAADGSVGYWQTNMSHPLWLVVAHKSWVTWVAISPDGRRALSAGDDGSVFLWDVELGVKQPIPIPHFYETWPQASFGTFLDDESILLNIVNECLIISLPTGSLRKTELGVHWRNYNEGIKVDFSPIAKRLIISAGTDIKVFDVQKNKVLMILQSPGEIEHVAISADGNKIVAVDAQGRLAGYDLITGSRCDIRISSLYALCRGPEGSVFFAYDFKDRLLKIHLEDRFHIENSVEIKELRYPSLSTVMVSLPGKHDLLIGRKSGAIILFDLDNACIQREWQPSSSLVRGDIFPDGQSAIGIQGTRVAGKLNEGNVILFINSSGKKERVQKLPHQHFISSVAVLGPRKALTVDRNGTGVIWEKGKVSEVYEFPGFDFTACTGWADNGLGVVGTRNERVVVLGRTNKEFELPSTNHHTFKAGIAALAVAGKPMCIFASYFNGRVIFSRQGQKWQGSERSQHMMYGTAVALHPELFFAASGDREGLIRLWHFDDGKLEVNFALHEGEVTALAFSTDGTILYTAGTDHFIYGIDTSTKKIIHATTLPVTPIMIRTDHNNWLFALDSNGGIYRFKTDTLLELTSAKCRFKCWRFFKQLFRLIYERFYGGSKDVLAKQVKISTKIKPFR